MCEAIGSDLRVGTRSASAETPFAYDIQFTPFAGKRAKPNQPPSGGWRQSPRDVRYDRCPMRVPAAIAALLASFACTTVGPIGAGRAALARADPQNVVWQYVQSIDINCDRTPDAVFTANDQYWFYVAVVLGPARRDSHYSVAAFGLTGDDQGSLCGPVSALVPEPLSSAMADATGEEELGYRIVERCNGLRLESGECDAFHLYWNHMSNALDWWRL